MAAEDRPQKPAPKFTDVSKPAGTQATSRPVIVGHGAVIRDPMMAPASWEERAAARQVPVVAAAAATAPALAPATPEAQETAPPLADTMPAAETAPPLTETAPVVPDAAAAAAAVVPDDSQPQPEASAAPAKESNPPTAPAPVAVPPTMDGVVKGGAYLTGSPGKPASAAGDTATAGKLASKPSVTLVGKKIQPLSDLSADTKPAEDKPADELVLPAEDSKDPSKSPAGTKIGAITVDRMAELKDGKEYKVAVSKGHASQSSWVAIVLVVLLAIVGAAVAMDAGWIDIGVSLPFDLIK